MGTIVGITTYGNFLEKHMGTIFNNGSKMFLHVSVLKCSHMLTFENFQLFSVKITLYPYIWGNIPICSRKGSICYIMGWFL